MRRATRTCGRSAGIGPRKNSSRCRTTSPISWEAVSEASEVIDKAEQEVARRSRPENLTAYELYLAGRSEVVQSTPESNKKAIELFEKAVAADPRLARAWAELSGALQQSMTFGADPGVALPASVAAARRAVEIDPGDAMAHAQLAFDLAMQGNFAPSEAEFDRALRLNPGDAEILTFYSALGVGFRTPGVRLGGRRSRDQAQSELSPMASVELFRCIFQRRSI